MNDFIHKDDLNAIASYLMKDKAIVAEHHKGKGLKFTYYFVQNVKELPLKQQKFYDTGYLYNFLPPDKSDMKTFLLSLEEYTGIIPVIFSPMKEGKNSSKTHKNICVYTTHIKRTKPNTITLGFQTTYNPSKGKSVSYIATNNEYYDLFKIFDLGNQALKNTYDHEIGHHFGMWDVSLDYLKGYFFDSQLYTIMSYKAIGGRPEGPMLFDVLSLRAYYGANPYKNTENNTYEFKHTKTKCVWDNDGIDEIVVGFGGLSIFDMRDGQTSGGDFGRGYSDNFAIAHGVNIENIRVESSDSVVFLNELDNNVYFGSTLFPNVLYFTDTHIQTTINHKNPKRRIYQKLSRSKAANGKVYGGWGHDTIHFPQEFFNGYGAKRRQRTYEAEYGFNDDNIALFGKKPRIETMPQRLIFDVDDVSTFEFYSSGENDLVILHKCKSIGNPKKIFTSTTTIKNFRQNEGEFIFYIRAKSPRQWAIIDAKYKKYIAHVEKNIVEKLYDKNRKSISGQYILRHFAFYNNIIQPDSGTKFVKRIADYDESLRYVATHQNPRDKKLTRQYHKLQQTFQFTPLQIKWDDVKDKKIDLSKIITKPKINTILHKSTGALCQATINKDIFIGEAVGHRDFHKISENKTYTMYVSNYNNRKRTQIIKKTIQGFDLKMFNLGKLPHNGMLHITLLEDEKITHSYLIHASKNIKKTKVTYDAVPLRVVEGSKLPVAQLFGTSTFKTTDVCKLDNLILRDQANKPVYFPKWNEITEPSKTNLHWRGKGAGVVRTINRYGDDRYNVVLFGLQ